MMIIGRLDNRKIYVAFIPVVRLKYLNLETKQKDLCRLYTSGPLEVFKSGN